MTRHMTIVRPVDAVESEYRGVIVLSASYRLLLWSRLLRGLLTRRWVLLLYLLWSRLGLRLELGLRRCGRLLLLLLWLRWLLWSRLLLLNLLDGLLQWSSRCRGGGGGGRRRSLSLLWAEEGFDTIANVVEE